MLRPLASLWFLPLALSAEPRTAKVAHGEFAVEYMVRSVLFEEQNVLVQDYLVVEVAFMPTQGEPVKLVADHFQLRLNGKKQLVFSQTPQMVAASVKYEDWEQRPTLVAGGGMGNGGILIGRPRRTERFPGDPRPTQERLPGPVPRAPQAENRSGQEKVEVKPEETVVRAALPEGDTEQPVKGVLYFAFKGKPSTIKKLELLYSGPAGEVTIPLL